TLFRSSATSIATGSISSWRYSAACADIPGNEQIMEILLTAEHIQHRVAELAREIAAGYQAKSPVTIVGVLTGSLIFLADLVRHLDLPLRIGLIQASSYRGATTNPGQLRIAPDLAPD